MDARARFRPGAVGSGSGLSLAANRRVGEVWIDRSTTDEGSRCP